MTIEMTTGIVTPHHHTSEVGTEMIPIDVPDSRITFQMNIVDSLPWRVLNCRRFLRQYIV